MIFFCGKYGDALKSRLKSNNFKYWIKNLDCNMQRDDEIRISSLNGEKNVSCTNLSRNVKRNKREF